MRKTLFISDLHLQKKQPVITKIFLKFLKQQALSADALYILGDFFEAWIGDDDNTRFHRKIIAALRHLSEHHVPIYFLHGNRDFLVGNDFAKTTGALLLPEQAVINLYGQSVLLMHGDSLCLADKAYLSFRAQTRNPAIQQQFLSKPRFIRKFIAWQLRRKSKSHTSNKPEDIMDVSASEVIRVMQQHQVHTLIHGHTHRPVIENVEVNGLQVQRIVLSDWHKQGNALVWYENGEKELTYFD